MIQQFSTYVISYRLFTFFTCLSSQKQSKVCNLCLIIVIYIYNQNNVGYKAFKITQLSKKSINIFYLPISFCLFSCCIINILLKVRQSRNNFFKLTFLTGFFQKLNKRIRLLLKYGFCKKSLLDWVCFCTQPKVIKKIKKRGNWSEFHFSEVTSYKIHTLLW